MDSTVSTTAAAKHWARDARKHARALLKILVPALVLLTLLLRSGIAHASHFRYGSIAWNVPNPVSAPLTVRFTVTAAWRSTFIDGTALDFGDGSPPNARTNGVQIGSGTDANGNAYSVMQYTVNHTYAAQGTYTAFFTDCCRVNGLQNGANGNYRVEAIVDLHTGNTGGPSTASLPIIQMQNGGVRSYTFAVTDPDNDPVTCRFPTSLESGLPVGQTVPSVPNGGAKPSLTSPVNACKMTWDLTNAVVGQQYVVHIVLESTHNGITSTLAIDLIVEIVSAPPPICAGSGAFTLFALTPFSTSVTGTHTTGGNSTVSITNGPAGSTLVPGGSGPSPFTNTFNWTPAVQDQGTTRVVLVNYTTVVGGDSLSGSCNLILTVSHCPVCAANTPVCDIPSATCRACNPNISTDCAQGLVCAVSGPSKGACVQCENNANCSGTSPICFSNVCTACDADNGLGAPRACPSTSLPYCASDGKCGKCTSDPDCGFGHAGPICNVATGACGTACFNDGQCGAGNWCNDLSGPGQCQPKVPNGNPVPGGKCGNAVASRACVSAVCDAKDDDCGLLNGSGPCTDPAPCRSNECDTTSKVCVACTSDNECPNGHCDPITGTCKTTAPSNDAGPNSDGGGPTSDSGGPNGDGSSGPLGPIAASVEGGGVSCALGTGSGSGGFAAAAFLMAAAALVRRRRRS